MKRALIILTSPLWALMVALLIAAVIVAYELGFDVVPLEVDEEEEFL